MILNMGEKMDQFSEHVRLTYIFCETDKDFKSLLHP